MVGGHVTWVCDNAVFQRLGHCADPGQRAAQVVAHPGDQLASARFEGALTFQISRGPRVCLDDPGDAAADRKRACGADGRGGGDDRHEDCGVVGADEHAVGGDGHAARGGEHGNQDRGCHPGDRAAAAQQPDDHAADSPGGESDQRRGENHVRHSVTSTGS